MIGHKSHIVHWPGGCPSDTWGALSAPDEKTITFSASQGGEHELRLMEDLVQLIEPAASGD